MSEKTISAFSLHDRLRHVARWASPHLPIGFATLRNGLRKHQTLPSPHLANASLPSTDERSESRTKIAWIMPSKEEEKPTQ